MSSLNKIILVGTVTFDPDIKATTNDNTVAKFTLSVERPSSGDMPSTQKDLIPIVAWNQTAEYVQNNVSKGSIVYVSGRISERTYEDTEGNRKWITEVDSRDIKTIKVDTNGADFGETAPESNNATESKYDFTGASFPDASSSEKSSPEKTSSVETKSDFTPVSEDNFEFNDPFTNDSSENNAADTSAEEVPF